MVPHTHTRTISEMNGCIKGGSQLVGWSVYRKMGTAMVDLTAKIWQRKRQESEEKRKNERFLKRKEEQIKREEKRLRGEGEEKLAGEETWRHLEEEKLAEEEKLEEEKWAEEEKWGRRRALMRQEAAERRRRNVHLIKYVATIIMFTIITSFIIILTVMHRHPQQDSRF